ncbi:ExbD/TolR family protein [Steroidobacter sp.]|uniref:ExbD/TolR family protein n=1 Tax=Steroidobacter sp. TaxID=1978227 RepID=UPI001A41D48F|nr:biopolymer transporter ExbD [Steroidobacter sp.]MBL8269183.1 biopolymer transporter ExbD [Steroidobacter sp.]
MINRIKRHRKRKHGGAEAAGHMTLVPFIDMLMILTVFLLVHNSDVDILPNTKSIAIPQSLSDKKPRPSVVVMITKEDLLVDGKAIAKVADVIAAEDAVIQPLKLALQSQADTVLTDAAKQEIKDREVTIMGDRNTPYSVLRKIMATCTDADYGKVSLAVVEREGAGPKISPNASARAATFSGAQGS